MRHTFVAEAPLQHDAAVVLGSLVEWGGERYYRITQFDAMPPFFMSLVSDSDHWLFISSNGALTAGRKDPDHALFPYYTDDRIHDSHDQTGSKTILRVHGAEKTWLWEPFSQRYEGLYRITRNLYKSAYGNKILFEEVNHDLGLAFHYEWMNGERFGFIRRATLRNQGGATVMVELLDGIQNVLPCGLGRRFQMEYSTLGDGYKRTELLPETGLALFRLSSIPVDRAEPSEALRVNVAWSTGLGPAKRLLSASQLATFRKGGVLAEEGDVRGQRGAYFLNASLSLEPGAERTWYLVAEVNLDASAVQSLKRRLESGRDLVPELLEDVAQGTRNLVRIVGSADGLQVTEDALSTCRHFSNTLFNVMRGGLPDDGYLISRDDLKVFLARANTEVAARHASYLKALDPTLEHRALLASAQAQGDPDLDRLIHEYLPLTFSRRHGDPSRPWNIFSIQVKDEQGQKLLGYEGNWRDIFQNWEALAFSFPGFVESMIFKFLDASTADGYNPYRVTREGIDWEVSDPHDPWSFIGYWGDHQVIYLLKLLEASHRYHPGQLRQLLARRIFTYANVPYRIKPYAELLADPRNTITFDHEAHQATMALVETLGADGRLLRGEQGLVRANLAEKLLVVILSKLSNYIPGAGIWMNTQRPEWNDANNALVGFGVSVVTLCYLRRFIAFCRDLVAGCEDLELELVPALDTLLEQVTEELARPLGSMEGGTAARDRKAVLDGLGAAGSDYRDSVYGGGLSLSTVRVPAARLLRCFELALGHLDRSIQANRRSDGLYHAYNLMKVAGEGVEVRHLYEMLEGQVAALSSGALTAEEALPLLDGLRASCLYRADQASYLLYPDRALPRFLEMNLLPEASVQQSRLLSAMLEKGDTRLVVRDTQGQVHFNASFRNAAALQQALEGLMLGPDGALAKAEAESVLALYEQVFDHQSFTGRSGAFYKYEGLGCIYWHMASKLLLAVDEVRRQAAAEGVPPSTLSRLNAHYQEIREGLGVHKSPVDYGAFPTDPYSHTPGFAGAQQPGMTGQVKEDFLTRFSELGVEVRAGRVTFLPWIIPAAEFLERPATFPYIDPAG
jgi:hypothetical protein